jgi:hypothetical protein
MNREQSTTLTLPIIVQPTVGQQIFTSPPPPFVNVNVTGLGWNLLSKSITWFVDPLTIPVRDPENTTSISSTSMLPLIRDHWKSLQINYIAADSITFQLDSLIERQVKLRVDKEAVLLGKNFRLSKPIALTPDSVTIRGPKSVLNKLDSIHYVNLDQEIYTQNYIGEIPVVITENPLVQLDPSSVTMDIGVVEMVRVEKRVGIKLLNFPNDTSAYNLQPKTGLISFWTERYKVDTISFKEPIILNYEERSPEGFIYPTIKLADSLKARILKPVRFYVQEDEEL